MYKVVKSPNIELDLAAFEPPEGSIIIENKCIVNSDDEHIVKPYDDKSSIEFRNCEFAIGNQKFYSGSYIFTNNIYPFFNAYFKGSSDIIIVEDGRNDRSGRQLFCELENCTVKLFGERTNLHRFHFYYNDEAGYHSKIYIMSGFYRITEYQLDDSIWYSPNVIDMKER